MRHIARLYTSGPMRAAGQTEYPATMEDNTVKGPLRTKHDPAVVHKEKLKAFPDRARTTRLFPFIVLASATGSRRVSCFLGVIQN